MNAIEHILEFDKVKEKWMEFSYTEWAKEEIRNTVPIMEESRLLSNLPNRSALICSLSWRVN